MTGAQNPFAAMMEQMQDLTKMWPQLGTFDPKALEAMWPMMPKDAMEAWFGNRFNENGLDAKTRLLLTLAGLTMHGAQSPTMMRQTMRHALQAGATAQQITEALTLMAVFAGVPAVSRAMELAREVIDETSEDET